MILPFSTQLNDKPTYFVEKILRAIEIYKAPVNLLDYWRFTGFDLFSKQLLNPKLHTIREDKNNRWKAGTKIDFFINVRKKDMFRFAPVLPVISTQKIDFIWKDNTENLSYCGITYDRTCTIMIDDRFYGDAYLLNEYVVTSSYNLESFAHNDGFDTVEDFFKCFNQDFTGKIIHWTDLKY